MMKKLSQLLSSTEVLSVTSDTDIEISWLAHHLYFVKRGACFFAILTSTEDRHDQIDNAIRAGAIAVVCNHLPERINPKVCYVVVKDSNAVFARAASEFYDNPSHKLKLIGVTGTNGKTTVATLLYELYRKMGHKAGLVSTVTYRINDKNLNSRGTTPNPMYLNKLLKDMVDDGCEYCFMEVASHALATKNIVGMRYRGAIFTNLTLDHLDYHKTFDNYKYAKKSFFDSLDSDAFALVNMDDAHGRLMANDTMGHVGFYSLSQSADYKADIRCMDFDGMEIEIGPHRVKVNLIGRFNAYNILCIYSTAMMLGANEQKVLKALEELMPVMGRLEKVANDNGIVAIVDYAHTPDALENVLSTLRGVCLSSQRIITVCGCGGNKDVSKRPIMADIAVKKSSFVIFTSDNPRMEKPDSIIADMVRGVGDADNYLCVCDRLDAIRQAVAMADKNDIILVAGKGHEVYQIINGTKHHFDDREELGKAINELKHQMNKIALYQD